MRRTTRTRVLGLLVLLAVLVAVALLSIALGARSVGLSTVLDTVLHQGSAGGAQDVVRNRETRLLAGLLVGAALGLAGAIMQGLTRNPLADPGLLGVNAGAALAVVCATSLLGVTAAAGYVWFALVGAAVVSVLVYALGSLGRAGATPVKLALAGAAVSAALTALTTAVLLTDAATFDQQRFWTVGSLTGRKPELIAQLAPFVVAGIVLALPAGRLLNALSLGEDVARGLGQRVGAARAVCAAAAALLCAAATAIAGPIWFVGLVVPHLARVVTGPDHRWILPYSMVIAPILLVVSDVLGRLIAPPGEVQVGIILSFVGGPFLIALVRRRKLVHT